LDGLHKSQTPISDINLFLNLNIRYKQDEVKKIGGKHQRGFRL